MNKIKVLVSGCYGKMGEIVCRMIKETPDMEVLYGFEKAAREMPEFCVFEDIDELKEADILPDVIIDFSRPECTMTMLDYAIDNHIPMVIATTGLDKQKPVIELASKSTAIFMSSNMSFNVALVKKLLQIAAPMLPDCDIEISEIHHNEKADSPSGTAIMFADAINDSLESKKEKVYGRTGKRDKSEIGISSMRCGKIPGTHTILFCGDNESIEITHTSFSRSIFAEGAIKAARFIADKSSGFYSMDDLI